MLNIGTETERKLRAELIRAHNREKIVQSELACLKARYQKLEVEMTCCRSAMLANHHHCEALQRRVEESMITEAEARNDAKAWKTKALALEQVRLLGQV